MSKKLAPWLVSGALIAQALIGAAVSAADIGTQSQSYLDLIGSGIYGKDVSGQSENQVLINVGSIINAMLGLLGTVAVLLILWAGFRWMFSQGEKDKIEEAKKLMINAAIGLAIILSAYAIANFVISNLFRSTGVTT